MRIQSFLVALITIVAAGVARELRNVVYHNDAYQEFGPDGIPEDIRQSFTHIILAFAHPMIFVNGTYAQVPPFQTPDALRSQYAPTAHFGLAIGGWEWLEGFAEAADQGNRQGFADNVKEYLNMHKFDFVDIDWEYPGATGVFTPANPAKEIDDFPKFLNVLNETLGEKYVTVAVGGKIAGDSVAFDNVKNEERAKDISGSVAFINIMAYDITNRADNVTGHHTSVKASLAAVDAYLGWGYPAAKLNLGFALYAKHFRTQPGNVACATGPECPMVAAQTANGTDTGASGWLTFEWKNRVNLSVVEEGAPPQAGACGLNYTTHSHAACISGYCCSRNNFCGEGVDYCGAGCQPAFGRCDEKLDLRESFARANQSSKVDDEAGAVWNWDQENRVFWTWETTDMMTRKFKQIVEEKKLGGVFSWALGQDTWDWEHLRLLHDQANVIRGKASPTGTPTGTQTGRYPDRHSDCRPTRHPNQHPD